MYIDYLEQFNGKTVQDFEPDVGIEDWGSTCYRIRRDYGSGPSITELIEAFAADPQAGNVTELIIGAWDFEGDSSESARDALVSAARAVPNIEALMFGDIVMEESEISWIEHPDLAPLFRAFPKLREFRMRGSNGLEFEGLAHPRLERLTIECGGLPTKAILDVITSDCPRLAHLELWLGVEDYGFEATPETFRPLLEGTVFPSLKYLGFRNSQISDDIAVALGKTAAGPSILDRIQILDLSLGTLGDRGAVALLENPKIGNLQKLDLHHHYISDEVMQRFDELDVEVDLADQEEPDVYDDDEYRYTAVAE